jgi:pimeloyl-ACP methyl ester carboxylesterase
MIARDLRWSWQGQDVVLGLDEARSGPLVLLLPALSSISTRSEMHPLMERLASQFHIVTIDWPGFGTQSRPSVSWTPDALSAFLDHVFRDVVHDPHAVVTAGHAATYVLHHAAQHPGTIGRAALIAPTWRGPLPTMTGGQRPFFQTIRRAVEMRGLGPTGLTSIPLSSAGWLQATFIAMRVG